MPVLPRLRAATAATGRGARATAARFGAGGRWFGRRAGRVRSRIAGGDTGMIRLFDLHAVSAAGDALIAIGLAGTIFFVDPHEARVNVALYLLVTMVPFALLAPLIGPLLDHVRHGRRYALAATMLGRAILAWLLADHLDALALYPAAFGVLLLSRTYGVARAAAVPRLLPETLTLSQANARGSVYGTLAGVLVLPLGLAAFAIGGGWPLRVASVIFLLGMVLALRLPAGADSDRPERAPTLFRWLRHSVNGQRVLSGELVTAALLGGVVHRALYGFLLVFLAFAIREGQLPTVLNGRQIGEGTALGLVSGALVAGTFLAVTAGSRLRIRRPLALQAAGLLVAAVMAVAAVGWFRLPVVTGLCLLAAISSGLAKLAVDSSIQERIDDRLRATAFARSETLLMLAFVAGGGVGLIPLPGQVGMGIAAGLVALAAARAVAGAVRLRHDPLSGRAPGELPSRPRDAAAPPSAAGPTGTGPTGTGPTAARTTSAGTGDAAASRPASGGTAALPPGAEGSRPDRPRATG